MQELKQACDHPLVRYLRQRPSHLRKVKTAELAKFLHVPDREICTIVNSLRRKNIPICSCADGYYLPLSRDDAAEGIAWFVHRFTPMREAYQGLLAGLDEMFGGPTLFDEEIAS